MTRIDAVGFDSLVVGMVVHHDKLGLGKIVKLRKVPDNDIIVSFMFYAPNVVITPNSIWLVDVRDVTVKYRNFEQRQGSLLKLEEVIEDEEEEMCNAIDGNPYLIDNKYWSKCREEFKQRRDGINTEVQAHRATEE